MASHSTAIAGDAPAPWLEAFYHRLIENVGARLRAAEDDQMAHVAVLDASIDEAAEDRLAAGRARFESNNNTTNNRAEGAMAFSSSSSQPIASSTANNALVGGQQQEVITSALGAFDVDIFGHLSVGGGEANAVVAFDASSDLFGSRAASLSSSSASEGPPATRGTSNAAANAASISADATSGVSVAAAAAFGNAATSLSADNDGIDNANANSSKTAAEVAEDELTALLHGELESDTDDDVDGVAALDANGRRKLRPRRMRANNLLGPDPSSSTSVQQQQQPLTQAAAEADGGVDAASINNGSDAKIDENSRGNAKRPRCEEYEDMAEEVARTVAEARAAVEAVYPLGASAMRTPNGAALLFDLPHVWRRRLEQFSAPGGFMAKHYHGLADDASASVATDDTSAAATSVPRSAKGGEERNASLLGGEKSDEDLLLARAIAAAASAESPTDGHQPSHQPRSQQQYASLSPFCSPTPLNATAAMLSDLMAATTGAAPSAATTKATKGGAAPRRGTRRSGNVFGNGGILEAVRAAAAAAVSEGEAARSGSLSVAPTHSPAPNCPLAGGNSSVAFTPKDSTSPTAAWLEHLRQSSPAVGGGGSCSNSIVQHFLRRVAAGGAANGTPTSEAPPNSSAAAVGGAIRLASLAPAPMSPSLSPSAAHAVAPTQMTAAAEFAGRSPTLIGGGEMVAAAATEAKAEASSEETMAAREATFASARILIRGGTLECELPPFTPAEDAAIRALYLWPKQAHAKKQTVGPSASSTAAAGASAAPTESGDIAPPALPPSLVPFVSVLPPPTAISRVEGGRVRLTNGKIEVSGGCLVTLVGGASSGLRGGIAGEVAVAGISVQMPLGGPIPKDV